MDMHSISEEEVIALVNAGGWHIYAVDGSGDCVVEPNPLAPTWVLPHMLALACVGQKHLIPKHDLKFKVVGNGPPRRINVLGPVTVREQVKKRDGGGWRDVERLGVKLRLVNPAAMAEYEASLAVAREAEQRKREEEEHAAGERTKKIRSARIEAFLDRVKDRIAGAHVVDLTGNASGLVISFDNCFVLHIELDAIFTPSLNVNAYGEKICLSTGEAPLI